VSKKTPVGESASAQAKPFTDLFCKRIAVFAAVPVDKNVDKNSGRGKALIISILMSGSFNSNVRLFVERERGAKKYRIISYS
jgi:hypothetical protein